MSIAPIHKNSKSLQPVNEFYPTPMSLTRLLLLENIFDTDKPVHEPACGEGAITRVLKTHWAAPVTEADIRTGTDFLEAAGYFSQIITNPPFSLMDDFVLKCKKVSDKFALILPTNAFSSYSRWNKGIWAGLKYELVFNRQVNYAYPFREDGKFVAGGLTSAWFIWDMTHEEDWFKTKVLDVNEFVVRGKR